MPSVTTFTPLLKGHVGWVARIVSVVQLATSLSAPCMTQARPISQRIHPGCRDGVTSKAQFVYTRLRALTCSCARRTTAVTPPQCTHPASIEHAEAVHSDVHMPTAPKRLFFAKVQCACQKRASHSNQLTTSEHATVATARRAPRADFCTTAAGNNPQVQKVHTPCWYSSGKLCQAGCAAQQGSSNWATGEKAT
jgi:hypothetical protein